MAFKDLIPWRQDPSDRGGATVDELSRFADEMGYTISYDGEGRPIPIPKDIAPRDLPTLLGDWTRLYDSQFHSFENREKRIKSYKMMDSSGGEGSVVLDTYADEIVNVVDNSQNALSIEFSDEEIGNKVTAVLRRCGVFTNMRQDVRTLCKYGDFAYAVVARRGQELVKTNLTEAKAGAKIDNPLRPEDLNLQHFRGDEYTLAGHGERVFRMKVERTVVGGFKFDVDEYDPWEFVPFSIRDRDTFPYGLSILEKSRVPFEQLVILEKLLAVSRANSVDRIAVKIPGTGGDPTTQLNKLSQIKNSLKTILQIGQSSRMTRNQDIGMTEWLFVPKDFEVSKLTTAIQISKPEDAVFFRDKYHNSTRLPKGFFITSDSTGAQRPMSLRQQDIKFARSLIPISEAYCNGIRDLCMLLAFYLGGDVSALKVRVTMRKSPYLSDDLLSTYSNAIGLIDSFVNIRRVIEPDYRVRKEDILGILHAIDAPVALIFPGSGEAKADEWDGNQSQPGLLQESAAIPACESLLEMVQRIQGTNDRYHLQTDTIT